MPTNARASTWTASTSRPEQSNAQTLWLGARIEYKLGNRPLAFGLGDQLRKRYPQSPEALAFEQGRFND